MESIRPAMTGHIRRVRSMIGDDLCQDLSDQTIQDALDDTAYEDNICERAYDLWSAGEQCLILLAARYKVQFDFSTGDQSFKLSQKREACLQLSEEFAARAHIQSVNVTRGDTWF